MSAVMRGALAPPPVGIDGGTDAKLNREVVPRNEGTDRALAFDDETQPHHPKHRRDDVPVDAEPLLSEFGENPDTSATG